MNVDRRVEHRITVERSRFYAVLAPVSGEASLEELLRERRKEYRKAVHHCCAARWGAGGIVVEKSKDDGEVGHPGRVLLEILRRRDLCGALVVSRIFGGVKLGVGGVSRAFRQAGEELVEIFLAEG